jgi:hypothetical protein
VYETEKREVIEDWTKAASSNQPPRGPKDRGVLHRAQEVEQRNCSFSGEQGCLLCLLVGARRETRRRSITTTHSRLAERLTRARDCTEVDMARRRKLAPKEMVGGQQRERYSELQLRIPIEEQRRSRSESLYGTRRRRQYTPCWTAVTSASFHRRLRGQFVLGRDCRPAKAVQLPQPVPQILRGVLARSRSEVRAEGTPQEQI